MKTTTTAALETFNKLTGRTLTVERHEHPMGAFWTIDERAADGSLIAKHETFNVEPDARLMSLATRDFVFASLKRADKKSS